MTVQYLAPTKRKKIGKREAARLFLLHNGICCNCGHQIRSGEAWFIEHVDALVLGGAEGTTDNRRPSHVAKCKAKKDAADAAARAKRDRIITASYRPIDDEPRSNWPKQRLGLGNNQHTASRPIVRKSDRLDQESTQ